MSTNEVKVGAFTIGGAALMAGIISFMGAFSFGQKGYELSVDYPQVNGLMQGQQVRYAGVQVGTVKKINVGTDKVEVVLDIDDKIKIPQGSQFSIGADGIMSEKYVSVMPPKKASAGFIGAGAKLQGTPGGGMEEFFNSSGDLVEKMEQIADAMNNVFGDPEVQKNMKEGFKNMKEISENMNTFTKVMADVSVANQQDIQTMIHQMNELSQRMNGAMQHIERIMEGVDNNGQTGKNIAAMAQHMADTSARMENIVGVLETVAKDPVTGQSLKDTLVNVKETSAKANKILGTLTSAKVTMDASRSIKDKDWRGNFGVTLTPSPESSLYMGGYDIGESNKFDFIAEKKKGSLGFSAGAMQGEFGVGLSYDFGNHFRAYSQLYDFDDAKVRVGGELKVNENFSLYGETMDVKGNRKDTYVGVRSYF